jgi:hypothetical protein
MGFYYDKHSDQERMINKFDKVVKRNKQVMDENHPDFEPTMLPLAEQFKYWERRNERERAKRNAEKENISTKHSSYTHYRPKN